MDFTQVYVDTALAKPLKEQFKYIAEIESSKLFNKDHKNAIMSLINSYRRKRWYVRCWIYRYMASKTECVNEQSLDMCEYNMDDCIILRSPTGVRHFFTKGDIIGVFKEHLLKTNGLSWEPEQPKNPYTNVILNLGQIIGCCEFVRGECNLIDLYRICDYDVENMKKAYGLRGKRIAMFKYLYGLEDEEFKQICENHCEDSNFKALYEETKERCNLVPYIFFIQMKINMSNNSVANVILNGLFGN